MNTYFPSNFSVFYFEVSDQLPVFEWAWFPMFQKSITPCSCSWTMIESLWQRQAYFDKLSPLTSDLIHDISLFFCIFGILANSSFEMCVGWAVTGWTSESGLCSQLLTLRAQPSLSQPGPAQPAWPLQCGSVAPAAAQPAQHQWPWTSLGQSEAGIWSELTNERPGQGWLSTLHWPETRPSLCLREAAATGHSQGLAGGQTGRG